MKPRYYSGLYGVPALSYGDVIVAHPSITEKDAPELFYGLNFNQYAADDSVLTYAITFTARALRYLSLFPISMRNGMKKRRLRFKRQEDGTCLVQPLDDVDSPDKLLSITLGEDLIKMGQPEVWLDINLLDIYKKYYPLREKAVLELYAYPKVVSYINKEKTFIIASLNTYNPNDYSNLKNHR
jgi:hypothetical protein